MLMQKCNTFLEIVHINEENNIILSFDISTLFTNALYPFLINRTYTLPNKMGG